MSMLSNEFGRESFDLPESGPSDEQMHQLMIEKAHELFKVCDIEEKEFITKRDMQRLQSELPLTPDQLEHVFDSLDDDGNGYLTLQEFTDGFGSFLGIKTTGQPEEMDDNSKTYTDDQDLDPAEEKQNFEQMMKNVGATDLFDDESTIQGLWCRLKRDDPDMASQFEDFVYRVSNEIKKSKSDFDSLESALRSKTSAHDEEVRKLYEEMEVQIKQEKEKILSEEKARERQLREAMENEIFEKDRQLQELMAKHTEMEDRLGHLNTIEAETKVENEKLAKEKEELEDMLVKSQRSLEESQAYINQLHHQQRDDKRERAKAAIKLSEGIAVERETLVKQLDLLKNMNRKLQDEKDEADIRRIEEQSPKREKPPQTDLHRRGSSLGKYFDPKRISKLPACTEPITEEDVEKLDSGRLTDIDDGIECDDDMYIDGRTPAFIHHSVDSFQHSRTIPQSPWQQRMGKSADTGDSDLDSLDESGSSSFSSNALSSAESASVSESSEAQSAENSRAMPTESFRAQPSENFEDQPTKSFETQPTEYFRAHPSESIKAQPSQSFQAVLSESFKAQPSVNFEAPPSESFDTQPSGSFNKPQPSENSGAEPSESFEAQPKADHTVNAATAVNSYAKPKESDSSSLLPNSSTEPASLSESSEAQPIESSKALPTASFEAQPSKSFESQSSKNFEAQPSKNFEAQTKVDHAVPALTSVAKPKESSYSPDSQRVQPVGADGQSDAKAQGNIESAPLQRVFKVVFVGDSGVGKSSFIHRFCTSHFRASYAATIGVDFQIKNLLIEGQMIVLQLWDTAGQERFRSITKQYFRKADGVVIMYDVTSETSFTNVRNWMTSVQDGVSDEAVLVLLGNKNDLPEDDDTKAVKMKNGSQLADEYGTLFYETSALSGENINNAMEALARVLKEKEDKEIEKSFHLGDAPEKKKGCCS